MTANEVLIGTAEWDYERKGKKVEIFFPLLEGHLEGKLYLHFDKIPPEFRGKTPKRIVMDNVRVVY